MIALINGSGDMLKINFAFKICNILGCKNNGNGKREEIKMSKRQCLAVKFQ